ncbi:hypothetical protein AQUSIP_12950 [Aquicella siphonis]|uniref:Uncharacterized protein n=1 Tax=Aquicella siphonis TaxID=254247 RepID=A0A5E4PGJ3_9COXI|nr:hypothetical protein [Aquicella siphonis]VVC75994.1 hypothetical protein AQUSIP_12950 [Aquicella siphonis]
MDLIEFLHKKINALCPIVGVSIGDEDNKNTWEIHYSDIATNAQKLAALNVLNNFVWDISTKAQALKLKLISEYQDEPLYKKMFKQYLINNPAATFSDYIDYLNS